ncbi:SICAvar, type I, pseudogene (fragment) [Plasmodium knowlesi strain H]
MAAGAATATTSGPCSDQSNPERQQSEAIRKPLKDAWDKKLEELRQQWEQQQNAATSSARGTVQPVQGVTIPVPVKTEVEEMLKDLGPYVKWGEASSSAAKACGELRAPGEEKGGGKQTGNMKNVCKVFVQTVNWMGNLKKDGTEKNGGTKEEDWKQYLRCVVGYEFLLRVLLPKYEVEKFMKIIFDNMEKGGSEGKVPKGNSICSWVKVNDVREMEDLIGSQVQEWLNNAKRGKDGGGIEGFDNIIAWSRHEEGTPQMAEERAKRKGKTFQGDKIIDLLQAGVLNPLEILVDPLAAAKDCIEKAENNGKDEALCNRLKCIEEYLQKTTTTPATTAGKIVSFLKKNFFIYFFLLNSIIYIQIVENRTNSNHNQQTNIEQIMSSQPGGSSGGGSTPMWQQWMQEVLKDGNLKPNEDITEQLKEKLMGTWDDLKKRLDTGELGEIAGICSVAGELVNGRVMKDADVSLKTLCKAMVQVRYFTSALKKGRSRSEVNVEGDIKPHEWYPRCLVGMVALSEIYGDHCDLKGVVEKLGNTVDEKLEGRLKRGANSSYPDKCKSITSQDILLGKAILGNAIKTWVQDDRRKAEEYDNARKAARASGEKDPPNSSIGKMGGVVYDSESLCKGGGDRKSARTADEKKQQLKENTKSMAKLFGMNVDTTQSGAGGSAGGNPSNPFDALIDDKLTLQQEFIENVLKDAFDASSGQVDTNKINDVVKNITNASQQVQAENCIQKNSGDDKLCSRLDCMKHLWDNKSGKTSNAENFWNKDTGEVRKLWDELSGAIKEKGKNDQNECKTMDDGTGGSRTATDPEKRACNHLSAGFNKLKVQNSNGQDYPILSTNPLLRQTVGCFLLKEYAKKMKEDSTCVIDSGLKKAFENYNTSCTSNSGSCMECRWDEPLDSCNINTNGTTTSTKVTDKLKPVQTDINDAAKDNLTKINVMSTLCDYIMCAGPKWFKNNATPSGSSVTATKDWCDFWEKEGVKKTLQAMFQQIATEGKNEQTPITINAICQSFGDGNPDSVERKACNHIIAGLKYIDGIKPKGNVPTTSSSNDQDKELLDGAVACIALNLYADQIVKKSQEKCPIDEERINKMFRTWNQINNSSCNAVRSASKNNCFLCSRQSSDFKDCKLSVAETLIKTTSPQNGACNTDATEVKKKMEGFLNEDDPSKSIPKVKETLSTINKMDSFCSRMQCAAKQYAKNQNSGKPKTTLSWEEINDVVKEELTKLIGHITNEDKWKDVAALCGNVSSSTSNDTPGEEKAKQKACKLFASGLKHISEIKDDTNKDVVPLRKTMMCAALNLYADQLINKSTEQCPLDKQKMTDVIDATFLKSDAIMKNGGTSCSGVSNGTNSCFICTRHSPFPPCQIGSISTDKVKERMNELLEQKKSETKIDETLDKINSKDTFCTQIQCAIKQHYNKNKNKNGQSGVMTTPNWSEIENDAKGELSKLLGHMLQPSEQNAVTQYCQDYDWYTLGHKQSKTNKAACLLFAAGLKNIYVRGKGQVKGPSFEQTMGCLFLKEYAKQLKELAKKEKEYKVHPNCSVDSGINYAFSKSKNIMEEIRQCKENVNKDCFECKIDIDYDDCSIGNAKVGSEVNKMFEDPPNKNHMQQTLENTVCPILLTDILTPFLPLAPVSIGLSAMAYYLWKVKE